VIWTSPFTKTVRVERECGEYIVNPGESVEMPELEVGEKVWICGNVSNEDKVTTYDA